MAWPARLLALLAAAPFALLAGCAGDPAAPEMTEAPAVGPEAAAGPEVRTRDAQWAASVAAAGEAHSVLGPGAPLERVSGANLTGVVIEMSWTPTTLLSQQMTLRVWRGDEEVGHASGPSPLRLALPGREGAGGLVLEGGPAGEPGAWVQQPHRFALAVFDGIPFDAGYAFG